MPDLKHQSLMTDALSIPRSALASSVVGMAHFASTGPEGTHCFQCSFWQALGRKKSEGCEKYRQMTGDGAKTVPGNTPSCRHFVPRPHA